MSKLNRREEKEEEKTGLLKTTSSNFSGSAMPGALSGRQLIFNAVAAAVR